MAFLSWTDHFSKSLNSQPLIGVSGPIVVTVDPAKLGSNAFTDDVSQVARYNVTTGGNGFVSFYTRWNAATNDRAVRAFALLNVRLPPSANSYTVSARALNFDYTTSAGALLSFTSANLIPIPGTTDRYNLFFLLAADTNAGGASFDISNSAWPTGYFEIGRAWAGSALVINVASKWKLAPIDPSIVARGPGGGFSTQRLPTRMALEASFPETTTMAQMHGTSGSPAALSIRQLAMEAGIGSPIIAAVRQTTQYDLQQTGLYALLTKLPEPEHVAGPRYKADFRAEQVR